MSAMVREEHWIWRIPPDEFRELLIASSLFDNIRKRGRAKCACGAGAAPGLPRCSECQMNYLRKNRGKASSSPNAPSAPDRVAMGLCQECGERPISGVRSSARFCNQCRIERSARYKRNPQPKGKCGDCGAETFSAKSARCPGCARQRRRTEEMAGLRPLPRRQAQILRILSSGVARNRYPSLGDMRQALGIASISTVREHLRGLRKKGYIDWQSGNPSSVRILRPAA